MTALKIVLQIKMNHSLFDLRAFRGGLLLFSLQMSSHFGLADKTNGGINGRIVNLFVRIPNVVNACQRIGFQATPDGVEFQAYGTQKEQSYITMMIDKSSNC